MKCKNLYSMKSLCNFIYDFNLLKMHFVRRTFIFNSTIFSRQNCYYKYNYFYYYCYNYFVIILIIFYYN